LAIDFEEMAALVELLKQLEFTDFRFEKGDLTIAVRRGGLLPDDPADSPRNSSAPAPVEKGANAAPMPMDPSVDPSVAATRSSVVAPTLEDLSPGEGDHIVTAPLLGTVYGSPKPGEPPFVTVGARVEPEDTVCVIEVMKLYNSVSAGVSGVVSNVLAKDGELVEFGQPLFVMRIDK